MTVARYLCVKKPMTQPMKSKKELNSSTTMKLTGLAAKAKAADSTAVAAEAAVDAGLSHTPHHPRPHKQPLARVARAHGCVMCVGKQC